MSEMKTVTINGVTYEIHDPDALSGVDTTLSVEGKAADAAAVGAAVSQLSVDKLDKSGGTMTGVLDLGGHYTKNASHYNNVGIRTLSYNENPKGYIYLPGRSSILIGITFNSGYCALYSVSTNDGKTISNVSKIIGDVDGLGFTIENENTLIITCNTPWSYGFVIYSGSVWASYF